MTILARLKKARNRRFHLCAFLILASFYIILVHSNLLNTSGSTVFKDLEHEFENEPTQLVNLKTVSEKYLEYREEFLLIINEQCSVKSLYLMPKCTSSLSSLYKQIGRSSSSGCQAFNCSHYRKTYFHMFWHLTDQSNERNELNKRIIRLNVMSFLATQNLCCTKLILWKTEYFGTRVLAELNKMFAHYIGAGNLAIKTLSLKEICHYQGPIYYSSFRKHRICSTSIFNIEKFIFYDLRIYFQKKIVGLR